MDKKIYQMQQYLKIMNSIRKQYVKTMCSIQKTILKPHYESTDTTKLGIWALSEENKARVLHNNSILEIQLNFDNLFPDIKKVNFSELLIKE